MKRLLIPMGVVVAAALVLAISALPATAKPARAQEPDLLAIYQQVLDAFSAGDVDAALAFFTDDAVVESATCTPPCVGKEEIRAWLEGLVAGGFQILTPASGEVSNSTLTARWEATDPVFVPAAGVERIVVLETVEFTGDKISLLSSGFDLTDEQTATFVAFLQAQQLEAIYGQFVDALAAGDVDAALALLTDDAVFEGPPVCLPPCVGKDAIGSFLEFGAAEGLIPSVASAEVSDSTLTARVEVRGPDNPLYIGAGIERIITLDTVEFTGDKISSISSFPDLTDEQTATFAAFVEEQAPPAEVPPTGGPPLPAGDGGFTWWYVLLAAGALAMLGGGALVIRRYRA